MSSLTHIEVTNNDGSGTKILLKIDSIVKVTALSGGGCLIKLYDRSKDNASTTITVLESYATLKTALT